MSINPKDLPTERPSSFNEKGKRNFIHPAVVKGTFRKYRNIFYLFLILIFLVVPWTQYGGEQTILLDLSHRRFVFFGHTFWAHDGPLIFFPLTLAAVGLLWVTSVWGRVWCGWACPQTVFIDSLFRRVEGWIEGDHIKRRALESAPWTMSKFGKKVLKWGIFFVMSAHIAHSFTAYFVGAKELVWITLASPTENLDLFIFVQFITLVLLFDFGWFREQFCIIMCPYGRFQSVLMGRESLAVLYDEKRGEPRRGVDDGSGDCVDCYRCVQVCPTGIDIRRGVQLECIACTACIDACNDVMKKTKKAPNLIRYASVSKEEGKKFNPFNLRSMAYLTVLGILFSTFTFILMNRKEYDFKIIRAVDSPTVFVQDQVSNHFYLNFTNQSQKPIVLTEIKLEDGSVVSPELPKELQPGDRNKIHFFAKVKKGLFKDQYKLKKKLFIDYQKGGVTYKIESEVSLLGAKN
ncbi:MAG: cytochrome c oxidase accessory protein CcoG [Bdellovibrionaceae bacterium]|nr:cytochrome c oxidase accessory protein CcoG [Pseudobdellovibrionaceae bacterium]